MKYNTFNIKPIKLALMLAGIGLAQASYAVDLVAIQGQWSPDGGTTQVPMWGFAEDIGQSCTPTTTPTWTIGPQLTDAALIDSDTDGLADDLQINLRNCLSEPVSIVIPGQSLPAVSGGIPAGSITPDPAQPPRATSFVGQAGANGGAVTYTWTGAKPGTYLYQSGSNPALQVHMGLYGALTLGTYPDTSGDVTLLYSEIDPVLHATASAATPLGYKPRHYLVNGSASQSGITAGDTNQPTVLRFLNAGLDFHVPTLNGGYMSLVAEDGNAYPFPKQQYSAKVVAGKTIDALWKPASAGSYVIYDRRGNGMVASLDVTAGVGAPVALGDAYSTDEDVVLEVLAPGILANDDSGLTAVLVSAPSSGVLSPTLAADGSFTYTPNADFNGSDSFTYKGNNGTLDSNVATVSITVNPVNDGPQAVNDAYDVTEGETLSVAAPGVLANDSDVDGDSLTAAVNGITPVGLTFNPDGSFSYDTTVNPDTAGDVISFNYDACDAEPLCSTATVDINVIAVVNTAPVAVEDTATVTRNSPAVFINLTANDSDADGNLKDGFGNVAAGQINITTGTTTTRGGTVTVVTNGVNYTPKRNFRGTDTFNYTVMDLDGAVSNEVTVRVNVVR